MMLAFKYPEYSQPDWETIQKDSRIKEQYSWYVGSLLWACDELLSSTPQTESWRNTIRSFIRTHKDFLMSPDFRRDEYSHHSTELRKVIDEVCAKSPGDSKLRPAVFIMRGERAAPESHRAAQPHAMRRDGSRRILPSCRSYYAGRSAPSEPYRCRAV